MIHRIDLRCALILGLVCSTVVAQDDEQAKGHKISLSEGIISMMAPADWEKKKPRVRILDYEFAASAKDAEKADGRITIMGAGGTIKANIDRWRTQQFTKISEQKVKERKVGETKLHTVDISGTYLDRAGPFTRDAGKELQGYRMLAVIIETEGKGNYFVKFYGPAKTVADNEKVFEAMIQSLKVK